MAYSESAAESFHHCARTHALLRVQRESHPLMIPYPFSAVVGMERAKRSLLLHAVDPRIGGCLLLGHRGCAKSTLARGFAALLPPLSGGGAAPYVEVPLGVTEDRLLGSLHAEALLQSGRWQERPGLLESAHEGVLYVDEINLLPDAVADLLLDSAASRVHRMERDGLSRNSPADYILVGTMNPDEGELRPQLSDRFAHGVLVEDTFSARERVEIGRRRIAFEDDPGAFLREWAQATAQLVEQVVLARTRLHRVTIEDSLRLSLAERASAEALEGMRAELAILRTARAGAALRGASAVAREDLEEAWVLCLGHRRPVPQSGGGSSSGQLPAPPRSAPQTSTAPAGGAPFPGPATPPVTHVHPGHPASENSPHRMQKSPDSVPPVESSQPPRDALPGAIVLDAPRKPRVLSVPQPLFGARIGERRLTAPLVAAKTLTARLATSRLREGRVRWQASVLASLRAGWRPGASGWCTVFSGKSRVLPRLWLLLDASRSGGARQFLAAARDLVLERIRGPVRVSALALRSGKVNWLLRNATASVARRKLETLPEASGKSPLARAVSLLRRAVLGSCPGAADAVWVCSDGLPTLEPGEGSQAAAGRLRHAFRRLDVQFPGTLVWVGPEQGRVLGNWLDGLLFKTRASLVRVASPGGPLRG